jgi:hypothetical protein
MDSITSSKKRKPALHLDLNPHPAFSSPLSHLTASRGFVNDIDTSMGPEYSVSSTTTPSPSALDWPDIIARDRSHQQRETAREPDKIFVVKVGNLPLCVLNGAKIYSLEPQLHLSKHYTRTKSCCFTRYHQSRSRLRRENRPRIYSHHTEIAHPLFEYLPPLLAPRLSLPVIAYSSTQHRL